MRLEISIDGVYHSIDSTSPLTLARWMVEIFGRVTNPSPATYYQVRAVPSYTPDGKGGTQIDWIADSRFMKTHESHSPRELLADLTRELDEYEAEHNAS